GTLRHFLRMGHRLPQLGALLRNNGGGGHSRKEDRSKQPGRTGSKTPYPTGRAEAYRGTAGPSGTSDHSPTMKRLSVGIASIHIGAVRQAMHSGPGSIQPVASLGGQANCAGGSTEKRTRTDDVASSYCWRTGQRGGPHPYRRDGKRPPR